MMYGQVVIATIVVIFAGGFTEGFFHLTNSTQPCHVVARENDTVDMICKFKEGFMTSSPSGSANTCISQKSAWQRADYHVTNLTDSSKYGTWDTLPGWKMAERQRISLLRVRHLQPEDLGFYQCRVQCLTDDRLHVDLHRASLCLEHGEGYTICAVRAEDNKCSMSFRNGVCDPECDSEENLYDGFDCCPPVGDCAGTDSQNCPRDFSNGVCDPECDSRTCVWDGGDCIDKPLVLASDRVVLSLAPCYQRTGKTVDVKELGLKLSRLLRTIVRVLPENPPGSNPGEDDTSGHRPNSRASASVRRIVLKIDNTMCERKCFHLAETAAKFLHLSLKYKGESGIDLPITTIGVLSKTVNNCDLENNTLLQLDLAWNPGKEVVHNIYSYTDERSSPVPVWWLVLASLGTLVILALLSAIALVLRQIRKLNKLHCQHVVAEVDSIKDKTVSQGTEL